MNKKSSSGEIQASQQSIILKSSFDILIQNASLISIDKSL